MFKNLPQLSQVKEESDDDDCTIREKYHELDSIDEGQKSQPLLNQK